MTEIFFARPQYSVTSETFVQVGMASLLSVVIGMTSEHLLPSLQNRKASTLLVSAWIRKAFCAILGQLMKLDGDKSFNSKQST